MLCIINYGSGNIAAVANICARENIEYYLAERPDDLQRGTHFLLPGVGAFDPTMRTLRDSGMVLALEEQVHGRGKPVLGICVGMHLLADGSEEGDRPGLGWIPGFVRRIDTGRLDRPPHVPHMGWNSIRQTQPHPILDGIDFEHGFYFLHSYFFDARSRSDVAATVYYGDDLPCVVVRERVIGAQFHPEKSHSNGKRLITNFARMS